MNFFGNSVTSRFGTEPLTMWKFFIVRRYTVQNSDAKINKLISQRGIEKHGRSGD